MHTYILCVDTHFSIYRNRVIECTDNVSELYRKSFYFRTMSLVLETCTPIDNLIQSSQESKERYLRLYWIDCSEITNIKPTQIDNVYYAIRNGKTYETTIMLRCLGNSEECTVNEFARIYSLPTHKHKNNDNNFRRYSTWLENRNKLITGFTKPNDNYLNKFM